MSLVVTAEARVGGFVMQAEIEVAAGEVVAVLGANGSGKTTLLRCLSGLQPLSRGQIALQGEVWDDPSSHVFVPAWHRGVGMVFQDHRLLPHLSVIDNVAYGLRGAHSRHEAREVALTWLARVGAEHLARRRPERLSGGESQRVALARAMAPRPRLLLLDEPTAAVDPSARPGIRQVVAEVLDDLAVPVIVVTHDITEARQLGHRELTMVEGRLAG